MPSDPDEIALEQYLYWRELGLSHDDMLKAIGIKPSWQRQTTSAETIAILADAYALLQAKAAA